MAAIDTNETKNSLFGNIRKEAKTKPPLSEEQNHHSSSIPEAPIRKAKEAPTTPSSFSGPKYQRLDPITVLLREDQKEELDRLAKRIMKHRAKTLKGESDKERITANTIIRASIDLVLSRVDKKDMEIIASEEDLKIWISHLFPDNLTTS